MISSIGSAMSGMAAAVDRFDRASTRVARAGTEPVASDGAPGADDDLIGDRVDQLTAAHAFAANAATIRTADAMVGTLIDTIA